MPSISYSEFHDKLADLDVSDEEIAKYLTGRPTDVTPFGPVLVPDPKKVKAENAIEELQVEAAVAGAMVNFFARVRRRERFEARLNETTVPVLYAEGDSWLQFPFLLKDLVDHLGANFRIWCTSEAGDTLENMVFKKPEYLKQLHHLIDDRKLEVRAFLFSGAGNDVVGKGADGSPALERIVRPYDPQQTIAWHIETDALIETLAFIEKSYRRVLDDVDREFPTARFPNLKVVLHGYDYSPTRGVPNGDDDRPSYARDWTGEPLSKLGFPDNATASKVVAALIDRLNTMTATICQAYPRARHADLRGTVPAHQWNDELHPTSAGFGKAAAALKQML
jgi:hypothetical protein